MMMMTTTTTTTTNTTECSGTFFQMNYTCDGAEELLCATTGFFTAVSSSSSTINGVSSVTGSRTCDGDSCTYDCCDQPCTFTITSSGGESPTMAPSGAPASNYFYMVTTTTTTSMAVVGSIVMLVAYSGLSELM
mmetsp:Transcript_24002/g.56726  ORF Transcript_24002/g.56726 Transcript_24002/m.56726 type:complete len:134 (-) Transcript_24002:355-756(-)